MTRAARQPSGRGYAHSMQVSIRLFAGAARARRHGRAARSSSPTAPRLGDVWPALELGDEPPGLLYAVNKRYAEPRRRSRTATRWR